MSWIGNLRHTDTLLIEDIIILLNDNMRDRILASSPPRVSKEEQNLTLQYKYIHSTENTPKATERESTPTQMGLPWTMRLGFIYI